MRANHTGGLQTAFAAALRPPRVGNLVGAAALRAGGLQTASAAALRAGGLQTSAAPI